MDEAVSDYSGCRTMRQPLERCRYCHYPMYSQKLSEVPGICAPDVPAHTQDTARGVVIAMQSKKQARLCLLLLCGRLSGTRLLSGTSRSPCCAPVSGSMPPAPSGSSADSCLSILDSWRSILEPPLLGRLSASLIRRRSPLLWERSGCWPKPDASTGSGDAWKALLGSSSRWALILLHTQSTLECSRGRNVAFAHLALVGTT